MSALLPIWLHPCVAFMSNIVPLLAKRVCGNGECNRPRRRILPKCHWLQLTSRPYCSRHVELFLVFVLSSNSASPLQKRNPLLHRCQVGFFHHGSFGSEMIWVFSLLRKFWDWSDAFHLSRCKEGQVAAGSCRAVELIKAICEKSQCGVLFYLDHCCRSSFY